MPSFTPPTEVLRRVDDYVPASLQRQLQAGAFWTAIVLPFGLLVLLSTGLDGLFDLVGFLALVFLNVLALIVGHDYEQ